MLGQRGARRWVEGGEGEEGEGGDDLGGGVGEELVVWVLACGVEWHCWWFGGGLAGEKLAEGAGGDGGLVEERVWRRRGW